MTATDKPQCGPLTRAAMHDALRGTKPAKAAQAIPNQAYGGIAAHIWAVGGAGAGRRNKGGGSGDRILTPLEKGPPEGSPANCFSVVLTVSVQRTPP